MMNFIKATLSFILIAIYYIGAAIYMVIIVGGTPFILSYLLITSAPTAYYINDFLLFPCAAFIWLWFAGLWTYLNADRGGF